MRDRAGARIVGVGVLAFWTAATVGAQTPAARPIFPKPFVVEHQVVQVAAGQEVLRTPAVADTYGGSWIVSLRPDRSRMIVDFARHELVEVRAEQGTYSVLGFDRFAELRRRLRRAEGLEASGGASAGRATREGSAASKPEIVLEEAPVGGAAASVTGGDFPGVLRRPGVRHVRVSVRTTPGQPSDTPPVDVWVDGEARLGQEGQSAIRQLDEEVVGEPLEEGETSASHLVAAAREWGGGGVVIRTDRVTVGGTRIVDEVSKLESLPAFPAELLQVPEGFRRVPHPLEAMVAQAESEAELNRAMSRVQGNEGRK
ncbi:MAG TPA: hypothetical protein PLS53_15280 [Thermoanaerobaculaceae bacterium]|nr:hypothetical protein [Thermoanaerobaculaceae bacterium]HPS79521.1 hypothetical protein [Thermoanaerobaculaceae bacterium]